jgi:hypothetical protein
MHELEFKTKLNKILMGKFNYKTISGLWDDFLYNKSTDLDKKYNDDTDFRTSTRGLKIRGTYDSYREAKRRSDQVAKFDKNHNVYIGQVGYWLPWDPDPYEVSDQEYQRKDLNNLMKKYRENLAFKDEFFESRNQEKMNAALKKNKNSKKVSKESEEELKKVRTTVAKKDEILNAAISEKRKVEKAEKESQKKVLLSNEERKIEVDENGVPVNPPEPVEVESDAKPITNTDAETVAQVFDAPDPWLQRKLEEAAAKKEKSS